MRFVLSQGIVNEVQIRLFKLILKPGSKLVRFFLPSTPPQTTEQAKIRDIYFCFWQCSYFWSRLWRAPLAHKAHTCNMHGERCQRSVLSMGSIARGIHVCLVESWQLFSFAKARKYYLSKSTHDDWSIQPCDTGGRPYHSSDVLCLLPTAYCSAHLP